jgi:hypothetical protein
MANTKKTNLLTNVDLTSDREDLTGRTTLPPRTPAEVLADRATWVPPYGQAKAPEAPVWYKAPDGTTDVAGGRVSDVSIQLFWKSNVGNIADNSLMPPYPPTANTDPKVRGIPAVKGLDCLGIAGHNIYAAEGTGTPALILTLRRADLDTVITGFYVTTTDPGPPPVTTTTWVPIKPETVYKFQVEAFAFDGTKGPKSAVLTVTTPKTSDAHDTQAFLVPDPPRDFEVTKVDDPAAATPKAYFSWAQGELATHYELYYRIKTTSAVAMDPARPGLMVGDVLAATIAAPASPTAPVTADMPVTPKTAYTVKVRAKRTVGADTSFSSFAPEMVLRINDTAGNPPRQLLMNDPPPAPAPVAPAKK